MEKWVVVLVLFALSLSVEGVVNRPAAFGRKLMQSSETTGTESATSGSSETIPSYSYTSGVTESYRNWDGETDGIIGSASSFFKTLGSILGGVLVVALIIAVIVLIVAGVLYLVKKRKATKNVGGEYVLMEGDDIHTN